MLIEYINKSMAKAVYDKLEDDTSPGKYHNARAL